MKTAKYRRLYPCNVGLKWLRRQPDETTAWNKCPRPSWMIWVHMRSDNPDPEAYMELAKKWSEIAGETLIEFKAYDGDFNLLPVYTAGTTAEMAVITASCALNKNMSMRKSRKMICDDIRARLKQPTFLHLDKEKDNA